MVEPPPVLEAKPITIELSVLVPCFNEEGNLPELVERTERVFDRRSIAGEIVLVNDGSADGTGAQIDALAAAHPRVVAVHHQTNRGIPAGWKSALEHSRGRYVCTIDADLQYQPEAIAQLYREACFSKADLVQGWRSSLERYEYDIRYYMSRGLDLLLKVAFAMHEHDVKSGFVIYKREAFEEILQHTQGYYYFQHLITVIAKAKGYTIRQVETLFEERRAGQSFISRFPVRMIVRSLIDIVRAVVEFRLRETKDQSLARALEGRDATLPAGERWRRRYYGFYRNLTPVHHSMISHNAPYYLEELERTQWLPPDEIARLQLRRLRRLLQHAVDHVGYYRELLHVAGLEATDIRTLDDFRRIPLLTKEAVRENLCFDLLSDNHNKRKIRKIVTSGSTGEPLAVFADLVQSDMRWASAMRNAGWTGYRFPDRQASLWPPDMDTTLLQGVKQGLNAVLSRRRLFSAFALDPDGLRAYVDYVRRRRPALVDGFAEALNVVANFVAAEGTPGLGAGAVVSYAQTLSPGVRALIEGSFGCRVFDSYGAAEFGCIAHECEAHAGYHVNAESFVVEIIRDGRPARDGEVGEVVVTDLNNRCVPLIRYRLGDLAQASTRGCSCGRGLPLVERVSGRPQAAVLGTNGRYLPATFFARLFERYEYAVMRYQIVQEAHDRIDVRIVRRSRFTSATQEEMRQTLADALGAGMTVHFEFVDGIPPGPGGRAETCVCNIPLPLFSGAEASPWQGDAEREAAF